MTFIASIPTGGLAGWRYLSRTYERQLELFAKTPLTQREISYFKKEISSVASARDLVADRKMLKVALGAFDLLGDINSKAFIRSILESSLEDPKSLVNRISDPRYKELAKAFDFSATKDGNVQKVGLADRIIRQYYVKSFEVAVGEQSEDLRLAMAAKRTLSELSLKDVSDNTKWLRVLAHPPLRAFIQTTFGLPKDFASIDIDQQLNVLKSKAQQVFSIKDFSEFADSGLMEKTVDRFLLMSQVKQSYQMDSSAIAVQLLSR